MDDTEEWEGEGIDVVEHAFECPSCGAPISMLLDLSEPDQEYIEDCEVCCRPIAVHVRSSEGALESFDATPLD